MYAPRNYDPLTFSYVRLTTANVVAAVNTTNNPAPLSAADIEVTPMLSDLIKRLLKKRPRWTYVLDYFEYHATGTKWQPKRLCVYDLTGSKQSIGTVLLDRHWQGAGHRYALDSRKLSMARQRGSYTYTTDVNKAAKHCVGMFSAKTQLEIYNDNKAVVTSSVTQITWRRQSQVRQFRESLAEPVMDYLTNNPAEFRRIPGLDNGKLDKLLTAAAEYKDVRPLQVAVNLDEYTLISIIDGLYFVQHNKSPVTVEELENLSEAVRTKLGMLKLVEPDTFVPNMGYRGNDGSTFFILPEQT